MLSIKSKREIDLLRKSCQLARQTVRMLESKLRVGMSTDEINTIAHSYITENGAIPSPLNYHGFPKSICTSRNEIICHGIPNENDLLKDGDILNLDVTTYLGGFHGDTNMTFLIGQVRPEAARFVQIAQEAMWVGIREVKPGERIGNIGEAIERFVLEHGFSVVHEYCGHGIGREFHEDPQILHYGKKNTGVEMRPGMTFTIEPMINMGKRHCELLKDGWTVLTKDRSLSAQFEHTVLVTESGFDVLTADPN